MRSPSAFTAIRRAVARRLFAQGTEEHLPLRMVVLALGWWTAGSLGWVGTPLWVWLGGAALLSLGHAFSWRFRAWRSHARAGVVGVAIVGAMALVPHTVASASHGDWLAAAYFLLLFQALASFELRSRGGLHASVGLSGGIFYLASQSALDPSFLVFLMGFTTLLLSFFAMSTLVDGTKDADVRWFQSRLSFAGFWIAVFVAALSVSAGIFLVIPKNLGGYADGALGLALPRRASGFAGPLARIPDAPTTGAALPFTASDAQARFENSQDAQGPTAEQPGPGGDSAAQPEGGDPSASRRESTIDSGDPTAETASPPAPPISQGDSFSGNSVVMQVRSPVLTYWRGQVFDEFDGLTWHVDARTWVERSSGSDRAVYRAAGTPRIGDSPLYSQTYFLRQAAPDATLFTGYSPLAANVPIAGDGRPDLGPGAAYRVVSVLRDFDAEALEAPFVRDRVSGRYGMLPGSLAGLEDLAREITRGAYGDLERAQRIVTYLDTHYRFDSSANGDVGKTSSPLEFLRNRSPGTSMDFATATVLLARAAGTPARLVTGYLPGRFEPFSGTYTVRAADRHAWAEVYINGSGWVPFDSTPRLEAAFGEGSSDYTPGVRTLFSAGYSDALYDSLRSSPRTLDDLLSRAAGLDAGGAIGIGLVAVLLVPGVLAAWRLLSARRRRGPSVSYSQLEGDGRAEAVQLYRNAERVLRRAGVGARRPSQTLLEHGAQAESVLGSADRYLAHMRNAAWAAAYDPAPYNATSVGEARSALTLLRETIRASRRRQSRPAH